ncbi:SepM family pheromone-processing serine protease [Polycladomyces abyssicola]|uniref:SepM family pheromone-processing serine protease n=1 Tax=Polycladomyces abyssicola TaxID=1125966 RepID=UPI001BB2E6BF|nr:SepM family pheromone-processing serine protease [Polycladomyces abyssicola]
MGWPSSNRYRWLQVLVILAVLAVLGWMIPVPYYVVAPGSAMPVAPMVKIQGVNPDEAGAFYLTTVSMKEGNVWNYLLAKYGADGELIAKQEILSPGENSREYFQRQEEIMRTSQDNAVIAAFHQAGKPVSVKLRGVKILRVVKGMPAEKVLKENDLIQAIDRQPVQTADQLMQALKSRRPGERVRLRVVRDGKLREETVTLTRLPVMPGKTQAGIGIVPVTDRLVKTRPVIRLNAGNIGGPSAGLMFSLEIVNRLTPGDLTKGYRVAGTGTISPDGRVGQIGGVEHKVVAAEREGATLFFVPKDIAPGDSNAKAAQATVRRLKLHIKVVPVATLQEAIRYLERLPQRRNTAFHQAETLTGRRDWHIITLFS